MGVVVPHSAGEAERGRTWGSLVSQSSLKISEFCGLKKIELLRKTPDINLSCLPQAHTRVHPYMHTHTQPVKMTEYNGLM